MKPPPGWPAGLELSPMAAELLRQADALDTRARLLELRARDSFASITAEARRRLDLRAAHLRGRSLGLRHEAQAAASQRRLL